MNALSSLKDIPGVFGSFVFGPDGALVARDMPAVYPDSVFAEIDRRLKGIAEAVEPSLHGFYELLAKFEGHWLLSRMTPKGNLNILADESVNFPALKMAANVAVKHLDELTKESPAPMPVPVAAPPAATAAPAAAPQPAAVPVAKPLPPAPPEHRPRRIWRGQVVD